MTLQLQAATPDQVDDIAALLCQAFNAPPDAAFADRRLLHWKYFASAEVFHRPSSFVLTHAESVVAHCAVAPMSLVMPREQKGHEATESVCPMDWVSGRQLPGAGLLLMKRLTALAEVAMIVGGSELTRAVIPKLGFSIRGSVDTFARVVRPLRQWRTRVSRNRWSDATRLLRNTVWSFAPLGALSADWTALPVERFTEGTSTIPLGLTMPEHGVELLNYWLRCPTTRIRGYEIRLRGARFGHFLLSHVAGQTRIADLRVRSADVSDWQMAYRLAMRTAMDDETTCEVVALASTPLARGALSGCGFRRRGSAPLNIYDPKGKLATAPAICWSFIDDDAALLYDPAHPYTT